MMLPLTIFTIGIALSDWCAFLPHMQFHLKTKNFNAGLSDRNLFFQMFTTSYMTCVKLQTGDLVLF